MVWLRSTEMGGDLRLLVLVSSSNRKPKRTNAPRMSPPTSEADARPPETGRVVVVGVLPPVPLLPDPTIPFGGGVGGGLAEIDAT